MPDTGESAQNAPQHAAGFGQRQVDSPHRTRRACKQHMLAEHHGTAPRVVVSMGCRNPFGHAPPAALPPDGLAPQAAARQREFARLNKSWGGERRETPIAAAGPAAPMGLRILRPDEQQERALVLPQVWGLARPAGPAPPPPPPCGAAAGGGRGNAARLPFRAEPLPGGQGCAGAPGGCPGRARRDFKLAEPGTDGRRRRGPRRTLRLHPPARRRRQSWGRRPPRLAPCAAGRDSPHGSAPRCAPAWEPPTQHRAPRPLSGVGRATRRADARRVAR